MATNGIKVNMTPSHPGDFIRTEVVGELGLTVTKTAEILGAPGDAFGPAERQRFAVAGDGLAHREGFWNEHGHDAADAGLARCLANARPRRRDQRTALPAGLSEGLFL